MAYDVELADRIRDVLETTDELDVPTEVVEKQMFGGLGFLVGGHMAVAAGSRGDLMMRVDPARAPELLGRRHVEPMVMAGREAEGWLRVAAEGCLEVDDLRQWVDVGLERVRQLPPKPPTG